METTTEPHASRRASTAIEGARALFAVPPNITYLNCASMAPQLRSTTEVGVVAVRSKESPWNLATPADWFGPAERLRALAARVMAVSSDSVALIPAVSYGIATAAANIGVAANQTVVVVDADFPSSVFAWRALVRRRQGELVTVRREAGENWTDAVLRAIEPRTAVVAVPPCHWTDGSTLDLVRIGARARAVGAALVVDASQALGAAVLDVDAIQPDFLVAVGYKWLLGPYGLGYLYAAPKWRQTGIPIEQAWHTRVNSDDFARLVDCADEYRPGARRFDVGESLQFVLAPTAAAALMQILEWGVPRIQSTLAPLTDRVAELAETCGFTPVPAAQRSAHMLGIRRPGGIPAALPPALSAANIFVSIRADSIRIAPHLYNDANDIDRLFEVLRRTGR
jgi:selenocysteine lyase/cysteine desulfurase